MQLWVKLSVKVKLFIPLLCVCAMLPAKAIPEMTYTVSGGTLNPTHSVTHSHCIHRGPKKCGTLLPSSVFTNY